MSVLAVRVGTLTGSISRDGGGLFEAIRSLDSACQRVPNVATHVFGVRDAHTDNDIGQWKNCGVSTFARVGPAAFGFAPGLKGGLEKAALDILHVHGLWMYPSVVARHWSRASERPYIVSPHGMLDSWAVGNSNWKKRLAYLAYEGSHLHGASCLRALSVSEVDSIRAYDLSNPIAVIPNGVDLPNLSLNVGPPAWAPCIPDDTKVLLFLGRLHPKKGLPALLHAWAASGPTRNQASDSWCLVVAGWDQGHHRAVLEQHATALGIQSTVHFVGSQFGVGKAASFRRAAFFVLPSLSEGLPMAVLEAWSWGKPVLMTTQCNLPSGFEEGAAIACQPQVESLTAALERMFALDDSEIKRMGLRGRNLVQRRFSWQQIGEDMVSVYDWLLGAGSKPNSVCIR